jgi:ergothioneine biosynthesis protein EgtB
LELKEVMLESIVNEAAQRRLGKADLAQALRHSRQRTLALFTAYERALGPALLVPPQPELNPPLWELGHIGWFADWWIARNPLRAQGLQADPDVPRRPSRQAARGVDAESLYHSSQVPHASRWRLPLPDAATTRADLAASLADTLVSLEQAPETDNGLYFFRLALAHEDMHAEAAVYMAQTLGFDPQDAHTASALDRAGPRRPAQLAVPASAVTLGHSGPGFAFDNELGPQLLAVEPFSVDAQPVSWAQFLPFIDSGSYAQCRFWSEAGWAWRMGSAPDGPRQAPRHLRQAADGWQQQRWGQWCPLEPTAPVRHLAFFEAQAWCAWAGRRLPTEAEWVAASALPGFDWGPVWEWTASPFAPFPGFEAHPYRDDSQPWFDGRPVLKGASAATSARLVHRQYRNYFTPERNDIFAGFRSVAV